MEGRSERVSSNSFTAAATKPLTRARGLICQLTETVVLLVLAESHADAACAMRAGTDQFRAGWLTKRQIVRQATCMVADGRLSLSERQEYDLCNDQALPNLQAATNQARTNGYRALRLR